MKFFLSIHISLATALVEHLRHLQHKGFSFQPQNSFTEILQLSVNKFQIEHLGWTLKTLPDEIGQPSCELEQFFNLQTFQVFIVKVIATTEIWYCHFARIANTYFQPSHKNIFVL